MPVNPVNIDLIRQNLASGHLDKITRQAKIASDHSEREKELMEACAGFEAIFLNTLMKSMRETLPGDTLLDDSHSMEMYRSMHDQYLTDQLAKTPRSSGIKEFLFQQLKDDL